MGAGIRIAKSLLVLRLVPLLLLGCSKDAPAVENLPVKALSEEEQNRRQLITDTRDELDDWFEFYHLDDKSDTLFMLREVWDTSLLTFPVGESWFKLYREYPKLFKLSPGREGVLDIYTYERVFSKKRRGRVEVSAQSPANEVALVYPNTGQKVRLMFCGTPCQFQDAWWRLEDEVIVVGLIQGMGETTYYPAIWQINLNTNQIKQYTARRPAEPKKKKNYLVDEVFDEL